MDDGPSTEEVARMRRFAEHYAAKTGTALHPDADLYPRPKVSGFD
jgi:ferredoxin-thioredoxin reductase catalytic subunit